MQVKIYRVDQLVRLVPMMLKVNDCISRAALRREDWEWRKNGAFYDSLVLAVRYSVG